MVALSSTPSAGPRLYLRLTFPSDDSLPAAITAAAAAEAARVWRDYGVIVETGTQLLACDAPTMRLSIVLSDAPNVATDHDSLGVIRFGTDGIPDPIILLYYRAVSQLAMKAAVLGVPASEWPDRVRDEAMGRALGRALAHEIGHFVLRWPHHSGTGLMRPQYKASSLTAFGLKGFQLTDMERARLQATLASNALPDATASCAFTAAEARP